MDGPLVQAMLRLALDERQTVLSVDGGIEALLGFSANDFLNATVRLKDRIHTGDADIAALLFSSLENNSGNFNIRLRHADGQIRCVRGEYTKQPPHAGGAASLYLLLQDAKSLWKSPNTAPLTANWRALMENTDDFIFFKDRNHVFTEASKKPVGIFAAGLQRQSVLGLTDYDLFPEKYADIYYRLEKQVFAGVPVASEVHESLKMDGSLALLDNHKYPIRNEAGEITGLFGVVRDVTRHHKDQQALNEAHQEYRNIFDGAVEGMFRSTIDGRALIANNSAARILGYESPEDVLASVKDLGHDVWVDPDERKRYLQTLIENAEHAVLGYECQFKRRDGTPIWVLINGRLVYAGNGQPAHHDGFFIDITKRKRAEAALRESEESLRESQSIAGLGSYVGELASGSWTSSDILDRMFGNGKEYVRNLEGWAARVHPDDRPMMVAFMNDEILSQHGSIDKEYRIVRHSDGAVRWVHDLGRLEVDGRGLPTRMLGTVRDITDRKKAEAALHASEDLLKESQRIAGLGTYITDLKRREWTSSEVLDQLFGIDKNYVRNINGWVGLVHPDEQEQMVAYFTNEVIGRRRPFDREFRIIRQTDLAVRWVHGRGRLELDAEGQPARILGTLQDITERKLIDAALRESQERLQLFVEHAPVALAMFNQEMRYVAVSHLWAMDHSIPDRDILGRSHYEINPHVPERWKDTHRRGLAGERQRVEEDRYDRADGSVQWLQWEIIPWRTANGAIGGIVMFYQDITRRKLTEAALRESEESLKESQRIAGLGSYVTDIDAGYWTSSDVLDQLFGIGKEYVRSVQGWADIVHPDDRAMMVAYLTDDVLGQGKAFEKEYRIVRQSDGAVRWVHGLGRLEFDAQGRPVKMHGTIKDITERQQHEIALRESKELLQLFIEHAPAGLAMFDREMRYLAASRRWLEMHALLDQDVIGRAHYEIFPELPEVWKEEHRRALAGEALHAGERSMLRGDDKMQWVMREIIPWRAGDGSVGGIIIFSVDITRQKENEERLQLAASLFTHAREGITITDPEGNILEVNEMFTRITGYTRDEALGKNPRMLKSGMQSPEFYQEMWSALSKEGHWSGEIWNRNKKGDAYAETLTITAVRDASGKLLQYVALFSDITQIKKHAQQLEHLTHYDALTNLPNRTLLADRLQLAMAQAKRRKQVLAVAYLDLDGFKEINDKYGHDAGDRLLTSLAFNMKCALREGDTLARLGGDEFVAVMVDLGDAAASATVLAQLLEAAAEPVQVGDLALCVSASVGVTFYPQREEADADLLLRQADQAMYQAKLAGGNHYHVFDPDHDESLRGRHENLEHIRHALAEHELVLYYQPKVNMRSGKVVGVEALIRWQHPERGLLPPGMFLPVIEDHPLAVEVGEWVIDSALSQMDVWRAAGLEMPVSVNVGALQLQQADFVDRLSSLLSAHPQVKPFSLEIEVLETSALQDVVQTSQVLNACNNIGVSFALDDFGTGYSSLTYLKRLPASVLKIDQSFVSDMLDDPENLNILEGVLSLASAFHRQVIAEGVETVEHGLMLLQLGCEVAQGYGIARPMPAADFPGWLSNWRPDPRWAEASLVQPGSRALLYARVEHRAWLASFEAWLQGTRHSLPSLDERQCRFGKWLEAEKQMDGPQKPALQSVEAVHGRFHQLADAIFTAQTQGRTQDGLGRLGELQGLSNDLLEKLEELRQHP